MVVHAWSDPHSGKKYSFPFLSLINKAEGKLIMRYYHDHSESHSAWDCLETVRRPFILDVIRGIQGDFDRFFKG